MRRVWPVIVVALALSAAADVVLDAHVDFPGYYAVFGLVGGIAVIVVSAGVGGVLRRADRGDDGSGEAGDG